MATITQRAARFCRTTTGGPPARGIVPEALGQSFKKGEFVYLSSGKATVCADDATSIYGMADQDASGVVDTDVNVILADDVNIFEMNIVHATPASSVTAITQVGAKYGLEVTSNKHYCDISEGTALAFQVQALSKKDVVGDLYGRVEAKVLRDVAQVGGGEKTA